MTPNCRVVLSPIHIDGIDSYVVETDDWYTIVIDDSLSPAARLRAYQHELDHIKNGDFDDGDVGLIEIRAHRSDTRR